MALRRTCEHSLSAVGLIDRDGGAEKVELSVQLVARHLELFGDLSTAVSC